MRACGPSLLACDMLRERVIIQQGFLKESIETENAESKNIAADAEVANKNADKTRQKKKKKR